MDVGVATPPTGDPGAGVGVCIFVGVGVGVYAGVFVGVGERAGENFEAGVGVGVGFNIDVGVGVVVGVFVGVGEGLGESFGVDVGVATVSPKTFEYLLPKKIRPESPTKTTNAITICNLSPPAPVLDLLDLGIHLILYYTTSREFWSLEIQKLLSGWPLEKLQTL